MQKGEANNQDKKLDNLTELARNIVWAHGDAILTSEQRVDLYGNGVDVKIIQEDECHGNHVRKSNPLPIADVTFSDGIAHIIINELDYKDFLEEICRPEKIDGNRAYSYYIGVGVAYRTLDELLVRVATSHEQSEQLLYIKNFIDLITKPLEKDDIEFIVSNVADHDKDIKKHAIKIFENIMHSEETRMGRINALRYAVAVHNYAMEQADEKWSLWRKDSRDRAAYSIDFVNACTLELIDQTKLWVEKLRLAEIFNNNGNFNTIVDSIPELAIAGSIPMSMKEVNKIHSLLDF